jgi:hypothetical protein
MKKILNSGRRVLAYILAAATMLQTCQVAFAAENEQATLYEEAGTAAEANGTQDGGQEKTEKGDNANTGSIQTGEADSESGGEAADGTPDVSVALTPQRGTARTGETAGAELDADINTERVQSANVKILLTEEEANALADFDIAEDGSVITVKDEESVFALERTEGGYYLTFALDESRASVEETIDFSVPSGVTASFDVQISEEDILIDAVMKEDAEPVYEKSGAGFAFEASKFGWSFDIAASNEEADIEEDKGDEDDISFEISAVPAEENLADTGAVHTAKWSASLNASLPEGLSFPASELSYNKENGEITAGDTVVAVLETVSGGEYTVSLANADESGFTLEIECVSDDIYKELNAADLKLVFETAELVVSENAFAEDGAAIGINGSFAAVPVVGEALEITAEAGTQVKFEANGDKAENEADNDEADNNEADNNESDNNEAYNNEADNNEAKEENTVDGEIDTLAETGGETLTVTESENIVKEFRWVDNNNEDQIRKDAEEYKSLFNLQFRICETDADGNITGNWGAYTNLTDATAPQVGLDGMPEALIYTPGDNYTLTLNNMPTRFTKTDEYGDETYYKVEWTVNPASIDGYTLVLKENADVDWYYILHTEFSYTINARCGALMNLGGEYDMYNAFSAVIYEMFSLTYKDVEGTGQSTPLNDAENILGLPDGSVIRESDELSSTVTVKNLPKYTMDGEPIVYAVKDLADGGRITVDDIEKLGVDASVVETFKKLLGDGEDSDYFVLQYDNAGSVNFSGVTDKCHDGGTLYITLAGITEYNATKMWIDGAAELEEDANKAAAEGNFEEAQEMREEAASRRAARPTGEFELWRYREGSDYSTASPVRDSNDEIIKVTLDTSVDEQSIVLGDLYKYDPEGYRYIYVLREYLDTGEHSYEQKFGELDKTTGEYKDTLVGTDVREEKNTYIYDEGTISNRITGSVNTEAQKNWNAAAFQAGFEDVIVELTLQSRLRYEHEGDGGWMDTDTVVYMDSFSSEHLSDIINSAAPAYNENGRELEYRWVETGVYQGTLAEGESVDSLENLLKEDGSFTLEQDLNDTGEKRKVNYTSSFVTTETTGENGDITGYRTEITNEITNEIDFDVVKKWMNENGEEIEAPDGAETTYSIYRLLSGEPLTSSEPVIRFTLDENGSVKDFEKLVDDLADVTCANVEGENGAIAWKAIVSNLPEYDKNGHEYEYMIMETIGFEDYVPNYSLSRDGERNYHAVITNAPGEGNRIIVRKEWTDDSDTMHREPVEFTVYSRADGTEITKTTFGVESGSESAVWQKIVGIGKYEPDEVFVLETKMGDVELYTEEELENAIQAAVDLFKDGNGEDFFDSGFDSVSTTFDEDCYVYQFKANYHRYEATYLDPFELAGDTFYVVDNLRLGYIDIDVTKDWIDGGDREKIADALEALEKAGTPLTLSLKLYFAEYKDTEAPPYLNISYGEESEVVTVGHNPVPIKDKDGNPVGAIQEIDLTDDSSEYYFYNLPKYDITGRLVKYAVEEVWVDKAGEEVTLDEMSEAGSTYNELYQLIHEYGTTYTETKYDAKDQLGVHDDQDINVTNRLNGSKSVLWHKAWNDDYTYENGQRPDIYLDIYSVSHVKNADGSVSEKIELYLENYRWIGGGEATTHNVSNKIAHWDAYFESVPKYDSLGYEIMYYAVEKTSVDAGSFDYRKGLYEVDCSGEVLIVGTSQELFDVMDGDGTKIDPLAEKYVINVASDGEAPLYALTEDGTFNNGLQASVSIEGRKIWRNISAGYAAVDLPSVTFELYQKLDGEQLTENQDGLYKGDISGNDYETEYGKTVATITVTDWASVYSNGSYTFRINYYGENTMTIDDDGNVIYGSETNEKLQKYDEYGRLYAYTLRETAMSWNGSDYTEDGKKLSDLYEYSQATNSFVAQNEFKGEKGSLDFRKYLQLPTDENGNVVSFPASTFRLYRAYYSLDGVTGGTLKLSDFEPVDEATWSSAEVEAAYNAWEAHGFSGSISLTIWIYTRRTARSTSTR